MESFSRRAQNKATNARKCFSNAQKSLEASCSEQNKLSLLIFFMNVFNSKIPQYFSEQVYIRNEQAGISLTMQTTIRLLGACLKSFDDRSFLGNVLLNCI